MNSSMFEDLGLARFAGTFPSLCILGFTIATRWERLSATLKPQTNPATTSAASSARANAIPHFQPAPAFPRPHDLRTVSLTDSSCSATLRAATLKTIGELCEKPAVARAFPLRVSRSRSASARWPPLHPSILDSAQAESNERLFENLAASGTQPQPLRRSLREANNVVKFVNKDQVSQNQMPAKNLSPRKRDFSLPCPLRVSAVRDFVTPARECIIHERH
jgi:hypothetical protein